LHTAEKSLEQKKKKNNRLFVCNTTANSNPYIAISLGQSGLFLKQKNESNLNHKAVFVSQTESTNTHMLI